MLGNCVQDVASKNLPSGLWHIFYTLSMNLNLFWRVQEVLDIWLTYLNFQTSYNHIFHLIITFLAQSNFQLYGNWSIMDAHTIWTIIALDMILSTYKTDHHTDLFQEKPWHQTSLQVQEERPVPHPAQPQNTMFPLSLSEVPGTWYDQGRYVLLFLLLLILNKIMLLQEVNHV